MTGNKRFSAASSAPGRRFLFLQGPHGPFFETLALRLMTEGYGVRRINFNGGDKGDWKLPGASSYTGTIEAWPGYLSDYLQTHGITDIVFCGCWRPVHHAAILLAREAGMMRLHGFEEGLLRPHWVTMDPRLPCEQAADIRRQVLASLMKDTDDGAELAMAPVLPGGLWGMVRYCMAYYAQYFRFKKKYPRYRTHRILHPMREWKAWGVQLLRQPWCKISSAHRMKRVMRMAEPFFLLCLQLDGDSQIRRYSGGRDMDDVMAETMASFARHAHPGTRLVVKSHPLDCRMARHERTCRRLARELGISDRVAFLGYGPLGPLVRRARGMVTVNSTSGMTAMQNGCPVKTLGEAVYNIKGLVDAQPLDGFWRAPASPDRKAFRALYRLLVEVNQFPGHFHVPACHEELAAACMARMLAPERVQAPGTLSSSPKTVAGLRQTA